MPFQNVIDTNWTSGEISPLMRGRVDTTKYQNGAELIENFIVRPQGGLWKRSGTRMVKETKLSSANTVLVPFEFSGRDAYMLEFGATAGVAISGIATAAGLFRITSTAHGLSDGQSVTIYGSVNYPTANGTWVVANRTANTFDLFGSTFAGSGTADGKWVSYPAGYIHFYKNGEPLMETTTTEVESFDNTDNGGYMKLGANVSDLPGWGDINTWYSAADNGEITISNNGGGLIRVTTTIPHTLRTGVKVWFRTNELTAGGNTAHDNMEFTITRINEYAFDLVGSTFSSPAVGNDTAVLSHGLLAGDKFYISGATNYSEMTEQWHIVASIDFAYSWTVANMPYRDIGNPTGEEAWTIPIEVVTTYTEADLEDLYFAQSADVLYICHPSHPPRKLSRLDTDGDRTDWLLADVTFTDGPYLPANTIPPNFNATTPANGARYDDVYLDISSYTHTATLFSDTAFAAGTPSADESTYVEYRQNDQWRLAQLPAGLTGGATTATVTILDNVLLHLDESVRLTGKNSKKVNQKGQREASNYPQVRRGGANGNFEAQTPVNPGANQQERLDPNDAMISAAGGAGAGILKSNFTNTFGVSDIGKYVRYQDGAGTIRWAQITSNIITSGQTVNHGAAVAMCSAFSTRVNAIYSETRSCTVIAYRNGATYNLFNSTDVGRHIRFNFSGRWTWGKITAYTSDSQVTVTLYADPPRDPHNAANLANKGRCHVWRLGAWNAVGVDANFGPGYPSVVCFHEQRLCFGNTYAEPQTVWMSAAGDFENFIPSELDSTVLEDNAVTYTLVSSKVQPIRWMESGPTLLIGTASGEWQAKSASPSQEPISPTNIMVTQHVTHGSVSTVRSQRIGYSTLFASRSGNKIRELVYDFGQDTFVAKDLTIISEHILRQGDYAYRSAYQQEPHSVYWVLLNDGTLAGLTFDKDQEVYAWHRHDVGGVIESIAVIPTTDGIADQLWMVVKRTVNSVTKRFVEVLEADFYPATSSDNDEMFFMDCGRRVEFPLAVESEINGLHHLEGETVEVVVDGVRQGTEVVTGGAISADTAGSIMQIGLPFTAKLRSVPPEGGSARGSSQGIKKTIHKMYVRVLDSVAIEHGWHGTGGAMASQNFNTDLSFYSNTFEINLDQPHDGEAQYTLQSSKPYPLNILSVTKVIKTSE